MGQSFYCMSPASWLGTGTSPLTSLGFEAGLHLVQAGKQKPDQAIGRSIAEAVSQVPFISKQDLEQLTNDSAQDVLLIMYLSNLVRTQLALADRLGTAALPLL